MASPSLSPAAHHHQPVTMTPVSPPMKLIDLRPAAGNVVNTVFILLEKYPATRSPDGRTTVCMALAADPSACVHLQLWGAEAESLQAGDIVRLTNGIFSFQKATLLLRAGKKGMLEKIGEFSMLFTEAPNMSRLHWEQDPHNPKIWTPKNLPPSAAGPHHSGK